MVAVELNQEAKRLGHDLGVARTASREGIFNADKCRIRWSYLHLLVSQLIITFLLIEKTRQISRI